MRFGLKTIIFLGGSLLMIAPALVAGVHFTGELQERVENSSTARLRAVGELASEQIGRRMHQLWQGVDSMARQADIEDGARMHREFSFLGGLDSRYSWIGAANIEGKVVAGLGGLLEGQDVSQRPWFRKGLKGPAAEDVHDAKLLEKLLPATDKARRFVDFSAPIRKPDGTVTGVLGAHFDWYWLKDNLESIRFPGAQFILMSRDRKVLSGPADIQDTILSVGSAIAAGQQTSVALTERWPDGKDYISVVVPAVQYKDMPSFGWSIIVRAPTDTVFENAKSIARSFWLTLGAGALAALVLLYLFADWIATPLRRALGSAERLVNGDVGEPPHEETRYAEASRLSSVIVRLQSREMRPYQKVSRPARQEDPVA